MLNNIFTAFIKHQLDERIMVSGNRMQQPVNSSNPKMFF